MCILLILNFNRANRARLSTYARFLKRFAGGCCTQPEAEGAFAGGPISASKKLIRAQL